MENTELFWEAQEQEENGLFGKRHQAEQLNLCVVGKSLNALFQIGDKVIVRDVINGQVIFVNENNGLVDVEVANQTIFIECKPEDLAKGSI